VWQNTDGCLHQQLGIGTGDEAMLIAHELATVKLPLPKDVLKRLPRKSAGNRFLQCRVGIEAVPVRHQPCLRSPRKGLQKDRRLIARGIDSNVLKGFREAMIRIWHGDSFPRISFSVSV
jgi:hypothetical protein